MLCKECAAELRINKSETVVQGDASPDTQTRVLMRQTLVCTNKQCAQYQKPNAVIETQVFPQ
ncbi:MAG: hypothetical protein KBG54_00510 [Oscillospiraceae bacterium]|nr:hypothetical protein [Oscillospiraceae bacterium]